MSTYEPIMDRCAICGYEFTLDAKRFDWFEHYVCERCATTSSRPVPTRREVQKQTGYAV